MNFREFKNSNEFDEILKQCLNEKTLKISWIQKQFNLSYQKAKLIYEEANNFDDEIFMHNALYELSFEEEPPTIARIMGKFKVSYLLAEKIYEFYMENC